MVTDPRTGGAGPPSDGPAASVITASAAGFGVLGPAVATSGGSGGFMMKRVQICANRASARPYPSANFVTHCASKSIRNRRLLEAEVQVLSKLQSCPSLA
jgi:hypothetical protein